MLETIQQLEDTILLAVNGLHTPILDDFMWLVSGRWTWVPLYAFLLFFLYKRTGLAKTFLWVLGIVLVILLSDQISIHGLRQIFCRMRPSNPDNPISPLVHLVNNYHSGRYGFPSAHAANTWALVVYLGLILRKKGPHLRLGRLGHPCLLQPHVSWRPLSGRPPGRPHRRRHMRVCNLLPHFLFRTALSTDGPNVS